MSSNTPLNNLRNELNKLKRETERKFQNLAAVTAARLISENKFAAKEDLAEIFKMTAPFVRKLPLIEEAIRQLSGILENITRQMVELEHRVTELEQNEEIIAGLPRHPRGRAAFRMKKSKSRKRRPKKKSRAAKRGKKKSRASKKRGKR